MLNSVSLYIILITIKHYRVQISVEADHSRIDL